jgi:hypothetical protein
MTTTPYAPSLAEVRQAGSFDAAVDRIRTASRTVDIPRGGNHGAFRYVTRAGQIRSAYGTWRQIARLLRRHGYRVTTIA